MHGRYHHKFEPDAGFRLFRDRVSVLLHSNSYGRRLTDKQNLILAKAIDEYMDGISGAEKTSDSRAIPLSDRPLTLRDFAELDTDYIYKYVSDSTWSYIAQGSFQFGTAEFYRNTPNIEIQDRKEGVGHFHLRHENDQLNISLTSGYNCAIFCGTGKIDGPNETLMRQRFGKRRIRIAPLKQFTERAKILIGAHRCRVYDVIYQDVQSYAAEYKGVKRFIEIAGRGDLRMSALKKINKEFFELFYEYGLMPGLYAKPKKYWVESERKLVFETVKDIRNKPIIVNDAALRDFVKLLD